MNDLDLRRMSLGELMKLIDDTACAEREVWEARREAADSARLALWMKALRE